MWPEPFEHFELSTNSGMVVFDPLPRRELTPGVFLGSFASLLDNEFLYNANIKIIVNCGFSDSFIDFLDSQLPVLSSDVVVLNLDLSLSSDLQTYQEIHRRFNRILQHYLSFFYQSNKKINFFINSNLNNAVLRFESPTINGNPLRLFFNINRLLKLITNINDSAGILFLSHKFDINHPSNSLLHALALLFLMDKYSFNLEASIKHLQPLITPENCTIMPELFRCNHYDDVLLVDSLKKFYAENQIIKQNESLILTEHSRLKRPCEIAEPNTLSIKRSA